MKLNDLTGLRFGKLVVIKRVENDTSGNRMWLCQCDCGSVSVVGGRHLTSHKTISCGCEKGGIGNTRHGDRHTRLYRIWTGMKYRCTNPHCANYNRYGGRGISVCEEWEQYESFKVWAVSNGYSNALTLDRIDNDGNYEPKNCRWATYKEQANNRHRKEVNHD